MGSFKDKTGKSRLGTFISKATKAIPEVLDVVKAAKDGDFRGVIKEVGDLVGIKAKTDPEAKELLNEFNQHEAEFYLEAGRIDAADRADARENDDPVDQELKRKMADLSFYGFISTATIMLGMAILTMYKDSGFETNEFATMVIAELNGVFMALLFTLKDYLFGGSVKTK